MACIKTRRYRKICRKHKNFDSYNWKRRFLFLLRRLTNFKGLRRQTPKRDLKTSWDASYQEVKCWKGAEVIGWDNGCILGHGLRRRSWGWSFTEETWHWRRLVIESWRWRDWIEWFRWRNNQSLGYRKTKTQKRVFKRKTKRYGPKSGWST